MVVRSAPSGDGTIASWIVNRHGFGGAFPLPSTAILVRLAEQDDLLLPGGWAARPTAPTSSMRHGAFDDVAASRMSTSTMSTGEVTLLSWEAAR